MWLKQILSFLSALIISYLIFQTLANPTDRREAVKGLENECRDNKIVPLPNRHLTNDRQDFYVITTIFNPASYKSRYALYHDFAKTIRDTGAQLVTIECIFPSLGQKRFHVTKASNPLDIQLKSDSVYWVKEDLINIAVRHLPPNARWVSWLDADIYFHDKDWIEKTISALERHTVVQMFEYAHFLNKETEIIRTDYSFGYSVVKGKPIRDTIWYPHPGYGWAMTKSAFEKMGGLPSYNIVGSGDLSFAFTLVNRIGYTMENEFNDDYKKGIHDVSEQMYLRLRNISDSESKSIVGYVPVGISHRWHGATKDRGYVDRLKVLIAHDFNYFSDMLRGEDGLLRFRNGTESLQQDILCYFENRNEDDDKYEPVQCNSAHYKQFLASRYANPLRPKRSNTPVPAGTIGIPTVANFYTSCNFYTCHSDKSDFLKTELKIALK